MQARFYTLLFLSIFVKIQVEIHKYFVDKNLQLGRNLLHTYWQLISSFGDGRIVVAMRSFSLKCLIVLNWTNLEALFIANATLAKMSPCGQDPSMGYALSAQTSGLPQVWLVWEEQLEQNKGHTCAKRDGRPQIREGHL